MTPDRLQELLEAYGADPARWPHEEREAALALIAHAPAARGQAEHAALLDAALDRWTDAPLPRLDASALSARVTATPQAVFAPRARRRPALAWPNVMGLAAAAVAGFLIGWTGLDSALLPTDANGTEPSAVALVIEDATW